MTAPEQTYPAQIYAARLEIDYPESLNRVTTAFRIILIVPIAIVANILSATAVSTVTVVTESGHIVSRASSTGGCTCCAPDATPQRSAAVGPPALVPQSPQTPMGSMASSRDRRHAAQSRDPRRGAAERRRASPPCLRARRLRRQHHPRPGDEQHLVAQQTSFRGSSPASDSDLTGPG